MNDKFKLLIVSLSFIGLLGLLGFFFSYPEILFYILPGMDIIDFFFVFIPALVLSAGYLALSFARHFILSKWYKKYQDIYAKHISFQGIEEDFSAKPFTPLLAPSIEVVFITFFLTLIKLFFITFFLTLIALLILLPLINPSISLVEIIQFFVGYLVVECYFLFNFISGISFFSWLKKHPDAVAGKVTFDKNATKALKLFALHNCSVFFFILAVSTQSFYLYGSLCYLLVAYIRLLIFNRLPLRLQ